MKVVGIIPARMASSRFPGKPLALIGGISMIEHVYRRASLSRLVNEVYIATPDPEIVSATQSFGGRAIMTSPNHVRGTDRVAEAAGGLQADFVANIQGDEPLLMPELLDLMIKPLLDDPSVQATNLMAPIRTTEELSNPNIVKTVCNRLGDAIYFSRQPIPTQNKGPLSQTYRQLGLYAFTRSMLMKYPTLPPTPFEEMESCDMLRFVEHGLPLRMIACERATQGVDTEQDRREVERQMASDPLWPSYRPKQAVS